MSSGFHRSLKPLVELLVPDTFRQLTVAAGGKFTEN